VLPIACSRRTLLFPVLLTRRARRASLRARSATARPKLVLIGPRPHANDLIPYIVDSRSSQTDLRCTRAPDDGNVLGPRGIASAAPDIAPLFPSGIALPYSRLLAMRRRPRSVSATVFHRSANHALIDRED